MAYFQRCCKDTDREADSVREISLTVSLLVSRIMRAGGIRCLLGSPKHRRPLWGGLQGGYLYIFLPMALALLPCFHAQVSSQELAPSPAQYTLDGDNLLIETDESGARHFYADGNVRMTYRIGDDAWALSAAKVEFVERLETVDQRPVPLFQEVYAERDIDLAGAGIQVATAGKITVNLIERWMKSESSDILVSFEDGDLLASSLEIHEEASGVSTIVNTFEKTVAHYTLSSFELFGNAPEPTGESVFGSLKFDFSRITIETADTRLEIADGEPVRLDCPHPTTVTSGRNTLTMPSCYLTFDPPTLHGDQGARFQIGEDTRVDADLLTLTYPEEGGMIARFAGLSTDETLPGSEHRVTISHPAGTFRADTITITINPDGTNKVEATGRASFEMPLEIQGKDSAESPG